MSIFSPSKCRLFHNATLFGFCITHILNTGCAKIWKKKSVAKRLRHLCNICLRESRASGRYLSVEIPENRKDIKPLNSVLGRSKMTKWAFHTTLCLRRQKCDSHLKQKTSVTMHSAVCGCWHNCFPHIIAEMFWTLINACNIYTNYSDILLSCNSRLYKISKPEL